MTTNNLPPEPEPKRGYVNLNTVAIVAVAALVCAIIAIILAVNA